MLTSRKKCSYYGFPSTRNEREREIYLPGERREPSNRGVGAWGQCVHLGWVIRTQKRRPCHLCRDIRRQVLASQDTFENLAQQDTLGAAAALVVVHDPSLKTLVNKVAIIGIVCWLAGRHPQISRLRNGSSSGL